MEEKREEQLSAALLKVALGYQVAEVTEEFAEVDGQLKLTKRKRTKKDVPPDLKAVQILLAENRERGVETLSDEELESEKQRLFTLLAPLMETAGKNTEGAGQVCDERAGAVKKTVKKAAKKTTARTKTKTKPRTSAVKKKKTED